MGEILNFPTNFEDTKTHEVHFSDGKPYRAGQHTSKLSDTRS